MGGTGQLRSFILSMLAAFPDLHCQVDDLYWMGNSAEGMLVAIRWSIAGTHEGSGRCGPPTGRIVDIWSISHRVIDGGKVQKEWLTFNEFGQLVQLDRG